VQMAAAAGLLGFTVSGCSIGQPSLSGTPPTSEIRIESEPAGAEARTVQGQSCLTPCVLAVPRETQPITISKAGYAAQTIELAVGPPPEHSFWESPPPSLLPNPVQVVLEPAVLPPPFEPIRKPNPRKKPSRGVGKPVSQHPSPAAPPKQRRARAAAPAPQQQQAPGPSQQQAPAAQQQQAPTPEQQQAPAPQAPSGQ
jgi:hypothetical protein